MSLEDGAAEFVMRNGDGTAWDHPPPEVGTRNYVVPFVEGAEGAGTWTLYNGRLARVTEGAPILVVSDLDHTMVGHEQDPDDGFLRAFKALWLGSYAFRGSQLVYSTGRNKSDALAIAREKQLLRPAFLVCAVGTEIYEVPDDLPLGPDGAWAEDPARIMLNRSWTTRMTESFDRIAVEDVLRKQFPSFDIRGNTESDPYRIPTSFKVNGDMTGEFRRLREVLGPDVEVIASGGNEYKLVDFCSSSGGKLKACEFVIEQLGFQRGNALVCGDSGNDESMYRCPFVQGVAVGNALPELVVALQAMAKSGPDVVQKGSVFTTVSESTVFYANRVVAGAIVEALERFWPPQH